MGMRVSELADFLNRGGTRLKLAANRKPLKETRIRLNRPPRNLAAWGPAAVWAAVLFLLSAIPVTDDVSWLPINDKVLHVAVYAVFGGALVWGRFRGRVDWPHVVLVAVGALYGVSDEWHQAFVPGRTVSLLDWIADITGILVGYSVVLAMISYRVARAPEPADPATRNEGV
jgi:VanZ family protein